ncbi:hypothetical protein [Mucilaginibacter sp.]|uniref:hypothetical protein n=1 Tax=Mucilaginibacter sp. TaxID=1882438 RepID=UPI003D0EDB61
MKCYICGKESTSVEHSPGKGFFPTQFRNQLITVPSCEEHNEATSMEDEYARTVIVSLVVNNDEAKKYFPDKPLRGLKKQRGLAIRLARNVKNVYIKDESKPDAKLEPALKIKIERDRIDEVMRKVSYGLFFHEYGIPWNRELKIGTEHFTYDDFHPDMLGELIREGKKLLNPPPVYKGSNPKIFQYAFNLDDSQDIHDQILMMKFYQGFEVWAFPQPGSSGPVVEFKPKPGTDDKTNSSKSDGNKG